MSWVKAAALKKDTVIMEELLKQLVQSSLQQQETMHLQQRAHAEAYAQQQETNRLITEQMAALSAAVTMQQTVPVSEQRSAAKIRKAVQTSLQKMNNEDDVEAYLTTFERIADREKLPSDQWADMLAPYLTGESQKAYYDLTLQDSKDYNKLKAEILARLGVSLAVQAQRVHQWTFHKGKPPRSQMFDLLHLVQKWLRPEAISPEQMVERVVMDRFVHALPESIQRWVAQGDPQDADSLVNLVERYTTAENLFSGMHKTKSSIWNPKVQAGFTQRPFKPWREQGPRPMPQKEELDHTSRPQHRSIVCWRCHNPGHIAAHCPVSAEAMECDLARRCSLVAHSVYSAVTEGPQMCQVTVNGSLVTALLDSGSLVSLMRDSLSHVLIAPRRHMGVLCVHGDIKDYPIAQVEIDTAYGTVFHHVGVVKDLLYGIIIGRDFPLFWRLWKKSTASCIGEVIATNNGIPVREPVSNEVHAEQMVEDEPDISPLSVLVGCEGEPAEPEENLPDLEVSPVKFGTAQWQDPTLKGALDNVTVINGVPQEPGANTRYPYFEVNNNMLYRVTKAHNEVVEQLVVPGPFRKTVLNMAHTHALGGHLAIDKTKDRVFQRFYWPGCYKDIENYCKSCPTCQINAPMSHFRSPLVPLPVIDVPFERIAMDLVGPIVRSARGHQYILVVLDYATRYPEAIPLRNTSAKSIARELFHMCSRVGLPKEILTDQGTPFMSKVMKEWCKILKVKHLRTSVYHPQTDGLVERFNKTLKAMLKKVVEKDGKNWDCLLPYLMFSIREVPQASTGFSPFELLYGRHPRGLLDVAKETWESEATPYKSVIEHMAQMQDRISEVMPIVKEHLQSAQEAQRNLYNRSAKVREFNPGDRVLLLVPTVESKFLAKWQGPFEIMEKVGAVNYKVHQPGKRKPIQIYHINLLKPWKDRESLIATSCSDAYSNPEFNKVTIADNLSGSQKQESKEFLQHNKDIFSSLPGRTTLIEHDIITEPQTKVRVKPYRIPEARRQAVAEEVQRMLALGVIEKSKSEWSSPIVLVPKPNGSWRFCNDFRKLNEVSKMDAYPMPRVDELVERLGPARYITTLDLTKGYWQIPLSKGAREKTAFSTPDGCFHYLNMPFGLKGAPSTFQRVMDEILAPHREYAAAYLDDIVIFSLDWASHLGKVQAVLDSLREAGFTANPEKCAIGMEHAKYLGYIVGRGMIKPQVNKVEAIQNWPQPLTKKQVRAFLGIVGYYRRFVPNFASIAAPLTDLTKGKKSVMVQWSAEAERAFSELKAALCRQPVLIAPNFSKEFLVQTDASAVGLGAVMSQEVNGEEHPIMYLSRKLNSCEKNYSIVERECLAIKWALDSLRYYLLGRKFRLVSDHAPLKWMSQNKGNNARVTRWFLALQDFDFVVEHRPGKMHINADALSRVHCLLGEGAKPLGFGQRGGYVGSLAVK